MTEQTIDEVIDWIEDLAEMHEVAAMGQDRLIPGYKRACLKDRVVYCIAIARLHRGFADSLLAKARELSSVPGLRGELGFSDEDDEDE